MNAREIAAKLRELLQETHDRKKEYEVSDGALAGVSFAYGYMKGGIERLISELEQEKERKNGSRRKA